MICDGCGEDKEDVSTCFDPFTLDVWNEELELDLCKKCYQESCDDI